MTGNPVGTPHFTDGEMGPKLQSKKEAELKFPLSSASPLLMVSDYLECCMSYPTGSMLESMSEISVTFFHGLWFLRKQTSIPLFKEKKRGVFYWLWLWGKELGLERPKCLGLRIKPAYMWLGLAVALSCPVSTSWTQNQDTKSHHRKMNPDLREQLNLPSLLSGVVK